MNEYGFKTAIRFLTIGLGIVLIFLVFVGGLGWLESKAPVRPDAVDRAINICEARGGVPTIDKDDGYTEVEACVFK